MSFPDNGQPESVKSFFFPCPFVTKMSGDFYLLDCFAACSVSEPPKEVVALLKGWDGRLERHILA